MQLKTRVTRRGLRLDGRRSTVDGRSAWLLPLLLGVMACADEKAGAQRPVMDSVAAVVLAEPEGAPISHVIALLRGSDGSWYVADNGADQVTHFAPDGQFLRLVGQRGQGPGEFESAVAMVRLGGDSIAVLDVMAQKIVNFAGDRPIGAIALPSNPEDLELSGDEGWILSINLANRTSLLRWDRRSGAFAPLVAPPSHFTEGGPLYGIFSTGQVVAWPDSVLLLIDGYPWARAVRATGEVTDSFLIPARLRRGTPMDLPERLAKARSFPEMVQSASALWEAADIGGGWIALLHLDQDYDMQARDFLNPRGYLTLINRSSHQACVDLPLTASGDARPIPAFGHDTLYLLDRRITDVGGLTTTITSYQLHPDACPAEAVMEF